MSVLAIFAANYFSDSLEVLFRAWHIYAVNDAGPYDHGPLVALIWLAGIVYLNWTEEKPESITGSGRVTVLTLTILAAFCFFNKIGEKYSIETIQHFSLYAFLVLAIWFVQQPADRFRYSMLSLALLSGVPVWDLAVPILLSLTVGIAESALSSLSISIYFSGAFVTMPYGMIEIAEGCSGLRYFLSSIAFSATYAFLYINNRSNAMFFIAITIVLAFTFNLIRVITIILIAYISSMESAIVRDHALLGWILFSVSLAASMWVGQKMRLFEERSL